jgi:hypothetical protein
MVSLAGSPCWKVPWNRHGLSGWPWHHGSTGSRYQRETLLLSFRGVFEATWGNNVADFVRTPYAYSKEMNGGANHSIPPRRNQPSESPASFKRHRHSGMPLGFSMHNVLYHSLSLMLTGICSNTYRSRSRSGLSYTERVGRYCLVF